MLVLVNRARRKSINDNAGEDMQLSPMREEKQLYENLPSFTGESPKYIFTPYSLEQQFSKMVKLK